MPTICWGCKDKDKTTEEYYVITLNIFCGIVKEKKPLCQNCAQTSKATPVNDR